MSSGSPRFTVAITGRNFREYAMTCIDSVKDQTFEDFECLVGDDASDDGSADLAERLFEGDPRFRVIRWPRHRGAGANMVGLNMLAEGEIVVWLSADDSLFGDALEVLDFQYQHFPLCDATNGSSHAPAGEWHIMKGLMPRRHWQNSLCFAMPFTWRREVFLRAWRKWRSSMLDPATGDYQAQAADIALFYPVVAEARSWRGIRKPLYNFRPPRPGQYDDNFLAKDREIAARLKTIYHETFTRLAPPA